MSLILDALRKLEREKDARAPGILVVGSVPWGETSPARRLAMAGLAAAALTLAVGVGWLLRAAPAPPAAVAPPPATAPPVPARPAPIAPPLPAAPPASWAPRAALPSAPPIRLSRPVATQSAGRPVEVTPDAAGGEATSERAVPAEPQAAANPAPERISVSPARSEPDLPVQTPGSDSLRLNAISKRDGRSVALINDRLVFEGDSFDGVRVIRIGEAEVEVEVRGERRILRF